MNSKEINSLSENFNKNIRSEFRLIFNERMNLIRGTEKNINQSKLREIESYRGNYIRKDSNNNVICRNGYNLHKELQIYMRLCLGQYFGLDYYVLFSEYGDFDLMKKKKLNVNHYLYSYLMKMKKNKSFINNYLFYKEDGKVYKVLLDKKLDYRKRNKYDKLFIKVDEVDIDIDTYNLLENLTIEVRKLVSKDYNVNSKWYYLKEYYQFLKNEDYDKFILEIFLKLMGIGNDYVVDDELIKRLCNEFKFNYFKYHKQFNSMVRRNYCDWNDKNSLIKMVSMYNI
jgi:hypothetical protein